MHQHFADWYREVDVSPDGDLLERRWAGIENHQGRLTRPTAVPLVKMAYGQPISDDEVDEFRSPFREVDAAFPMRDNDQELAVLAASTVIACLVAGSDDAETHLSMLVRTCDLAGRTPVIQDVTEAAANYIATRGESVRNVKTQGTTASINPDQVAAAFKTLSDKADPNANLTEDFKNAGEHLKSVLTGIETSLKRAFGYAERLASAQQEQIDVLWWLFGEQARRLADGTPEPGIPVLAGFGLAEQLNRWPPPLSHEAFVDRALLDCEVEPSADVTFADAVDALLERGRGHIPHDAPESLARLLPLHTSLTVANDLGEQWAIAAESRTGIDTGESWTNSRLAQLALYEAGVVATAGHL